MLAHRWANVGDVGPATSRNFAVISPERELRGEPDIITVVDQYFSTRLRQRLIAGVLLNSKYPSLTLFCPHNQLNDVRRPKGATGEARWSK